MHCVVRAAYDMIVGNEVHLGVRVHLDESMWPLILGICVPSDSRAKVWTVSSRYYSIFS